MRRKAGDWRRKKVEGRQEREDRRGKTGEGRQGDRRREDRRRETGNGRQWTVDGVGRETVDWWTGVDRRRGTVDDKQWMVDGRQWTLMDGRRFSDAIFVECSALFSM